MHLKNIGIGAFKVLFIVVLMTLGINAADLTLNVKYGKTGGIAGDLNSVGDMVNGRDICPQTNTNANGTPGCDMSKDPGAQ